MSNDLSGIARHELEAEVIRLRTQVAQQQELLERQQTAVHRMAQELLGLRREADRIARELRGLETRTAIPAVENR